MVEFLKISGNVLLKSEKKRADEIILMKAIEKANKLGMQNKLVERITSGLNCENNNIEIRFDYKYIGFWYKIYFFIKVFLKWLFDK